MPTRRFHLTQALPAILCAAAASVSASAGGKGGVVIQGRAGAPLSGLSALELSRFEAGRLAYQTPFGFATGLGPVMNKSNCASCHSNPLGGWGSISVVRFGMEEKGEFMPLEELGGSLLQSLSISDPCRESIPAEATVIRTRLTNASLAYGMVEAIPDAAIAANDDPTDANGDGISGRVHWVLPLEASPSSPLRAGRFGWKSQVATVLSFSGDATRNELGITNALIPTESAPNGDMSLLASCDTIPDPEDAVGVDGLTFIERVTFFQRYLGVPPQTPRSGMTGESLFVSIGCAKCHVPEWTTANSPSLESPLRGKTIRPYSDFLIHDMGLLGDGIQDGDANESEIRTPTLWNLRTRDPMLHDGSAAGGEFPDRVTQAILAHGPIGEGAASAAAFAALSTTQKDQLIAFLGSLGRLEFDFDDDNNVSIYDMPLFSACRGTAVTPDSPCAVGDIDQDGSVGASDIAAFLVAAARDGTDTTGDCDGDGIVDLEEIFYGAADADLNGIPDACESTPCPADFDGSGTVNAADLATLLNSWGTAGCDLNADGTTNAADLASLLNAWGACP